MLFASTHCFGESWDYCLEMHSEKSEAAANARKSKYMDRTLKLPNTQ